ncbi:hypothetical protein HY772_01575 [Candidatus Woesearchaeota archaeon]|nr:hypothetical protein [Candidatus Woesearchaeota archaeon]
MKIEKKTYFQKPQTMEDILSRRTVRRADKGLIAEISHLSADEALIVPPFIHERFDSRQRYLKRVKSITLPRVNVSGIRKNHLKPYGLLEDAVSNFKLGFGAGYTYRSVKDGVHSRIYFDDCIAGDILYTYLAEARLTYFEAKPYSTVQEAQVKGGKFKVSVPSRTKKIRRYKFTMEFVPIKGCINNDILWTHVYSDHLCPIKENDFSYRYNRVHQWDPHEIAAYFSIAAEAARQGDTSAADHTALTRPTQKTVDFYGRMVNQVAVDVRDVRGQSHKRPLNKAEREALLVAYVKKTGLPETFVPLTGLEAFAHYR